MKNSALCFILLLGTQIAMAQAPVEEPMLYAEMVSQSYAEGDSGESSGWQGCWYDNSSKTHPVISCEGHLTTLMHGGHPVQQSFQCQFKFNKSLQERVYNVLVEECWIGAGRRSCCSHFTSCGCDELEAY